MIRSEGVSWVISQTIDNSPSKGMNYTVKLSDHPLMTRKSGYANWPPKWTTPHWDEDDKPEGEVGVLDDVEMHTLIDNKIFLFMQYRSYRYMGVLAFDDLKFCHAIYSLLQSNLGRTIQEIGDLDLSSTL